MWGTNDIPTILDDYFEGTWYEQPERYIRMSPLAHVDKVTTPTLILHGDEGSGFRPEIDAVLRDGVGLSEIHAAWRNRR